MPSNLGDQPHIFAGRQAGNEIVELKDKADMVAAITGQLGIVKVGQLLIAIKYRPLAGRIESAKDIQQRTLAAARGAQQHNKFAPVQIEIHTTQCMHVDLAHVVDLGDAARGEDRFRCCCRCVAHLRNSVIPLRALKKPALKGDSDCLICHAGLLVYPLC